MTTVLLTVLGVLIAATAALMMYFFGGDAFGSSSDKADAARLIGDSVQIQAAVQMYHAQEGKMPGNGSGVDPLAMQDLLTKSYLKQIPANYNGDASAWKIDWNYGIARSMIGDAADASGKDTRAMRICKAARLQLHLAGDPKRCDDPSIAVSEPCCIMSAADAAS